MAQRAHTNMRKHSPKAEPLEGSTQCSSLDSDPGTLGRPGITHLSFSCLWGVPSLLQWGSRWLWTFPLFPPERKGLSKVTEFHAKDGEVGKPGPVTEAGCGNAPVRRQVGRGFPVKALVTTVPLAGMSLQETPDSVSMFPSYGKQIRLTGCGS